MKYVCFVLLLLATNLRASSELSVSTSQPVKWLKIIKVNYFDAKNVRLELIFKGKFGELYADNKLLTKKPSKLKVHVRLDKDRLLRLEYRSSKGKKKAFYRIVRSINKTNTALALNIANSTYQQSNTSAFEGRIISISFDHVFSSYPVWLRSDIGVSSTLDFNMRPVFTDLHWLWGSPPFLIGLGGFHFSTLVDNNQIGISNLMGASLLLSAKLSTTSGTQFQPTLTYAPVLNGDSFGFDQFNMKADLEISRGGHWFTRLFYTKLAVSKGVIDIDWSSLGMGIGRKF
jgi:hypothetical protein